MPRFRRKGSSGDCISAETVNGYQTGGGRYVRTPLEADEVDKHRDPNKGTSFEVKADLAAIANSPYKGEVSKQVQLRSLTQTRQELLENLAKEPPGQPSPKVSKRMVENRKFEAGFVRFQDNLGKVKANGESLKSVFETFGGSANILTKTPSGRATLTWLGSEFAENLLAGIYPDGVPKNKEKEQTERILSAAFATEAMKLLEAGQLNQAGFNALMAGFAAGMRGSSGEFYTGQISNPNAKAKNKPVALAGAKLGDPAQAALLGRLGGRPGNTESNDLAQASRQALQFAGSEPTIPHLIHKLATLDKVDQHSISLDHKHTVKGQPPGSPSTENPAGDSKQTPAPSSAPNSLNAQITQLTQAFQGLQGNLDQASEHTAASLRKLEQDSKTLQSRLSDLERDATQGQTVQAMQAQLYRLSVSIAALTELLRSQYREAKPNPSDQPPQLTANDLKPIQDQLTDVTGLLAEILKRLDGVNPTQVPTAAIEREAKPSKVAPSSELRKFPSDRAQTDRDDVTDSDRSNQSDDDGDPSLSTLRGAAGLGNPSTDSKAGAVGLGDSKVTSDITAEAVDSAQVPAPERQAAQPALPPTQITQEQLEPEERVLGLEQEIADGERDLALAQEEFDLEQEQQALDEAERPQALAQPIAAADAGPPDMANAGPVPDPNAAPGNQNPSIANANQVAELEAVAVNDANNVPGPVPAQGLDAADIADADAIAHDNAQPPPLAPQDAVAPPARKRPQPDGPNALPAEPAKRSRVAQPAETKASDAVTLGETPATFESALTPNNPSTDSKADAVGLGDSKGTSDATAEAADPAQVSAPKHQVAQPTLPPTQITQEQLERAELALRLQREIPELERNIEQLQRQIDQEREEQERNVAARQAAEARPLAPAAAVHGAATQQTSERPQPDRAGSTPPGPVERPRPGTDPFTENKATKNNSDDVMPGETPDALEGALARSNASSDNSAGELGSDSYNAQGALNRHALTFAESVKKAGADIRQTARALKNLQTSQLDSEEAQRRLLRMDQKSLRFDTAKAPDQSAAASGGGKPRQAGAIARRAAQLQSADEMRQRRLQTQPTTLFESDLARGKELQSELGQQQAKRFTAVFDALIDSSENTKVAFVSNLIRLSEDHLGLHVTADEARYAKNFLSALETHASDVHTTIWQAPLDKARAATRLQPTAKKEPAKLRELLGESPNELLDQAREAGREFSGKPSLKALQDKELTRALTKLIETAVNEEANREKLIQGNSALDPADRTRLRSEMEALNRDVRQAMIGSIFEHLETSGPMQQTSEGQRKFISTVSTVIGHLQGTRGYEGLVDTMLGTIDDYRADLESGLGRVIREHGRAAQDGKSIANRAPAPGPELGDQGQQAEKEEGVTDEAGVRIHPGSEAPSRINAVASGSESASNEQRVALAPSSSQRTPDGQADILAKKVDRSNLHQAPRAIAYAAEEVGRLVETTKSVGEHDTWPELMENINGQMAIMGHDTKAPVIAGVQWIPWNGVGQRLGSNLSVAATKADAQDVADEVAEFLAAAAVQVTDPQDLTELVTGWINAVSDKTLLHAISGAYEAFPPTAASGTIPAAHRVAMQTILGATASRLKRSLPSALGVEPKVFINFQDGVNALLRSFEE